MSSDTYRTRMKAQAKIDQRIEAVWDRALSIGPQFAIQFSKTKTPGDVRALPDEMLLHVLELARLGTKE